MARFACPAATARQAEEEWCGVSAPSVLVHGCHVFCFSLGSCYLRKDFLFHLPQQENIMGSHGIVVEEGESAVTHCTNRFAAALFISFPLFKECRDEVRWLPVIFSRVEVLVGGVMCALSFKVLPKKEPVWERMSDLFFLFVCFSLMFC